MKTNFGPIKMNRFFVAACAVIISLSVGTICHEASASAFSDGNFSTASDPGSYTTYYEGGPTIGSSWVVGGSVDLIGTYWSAPGSARSVDLNGYTRAGSISQTFDTVVGQQYDVSFLMSGNPDGGPGPRSLLVTLYSDPTQSQFFQFNVSSGADISEMIFIPYTVSYTAQSTSTTLMFQSLNVGSSYGPVVANINVSAVPIPGSALLLGSSLLGLVGIGSRRKQH